MTRPGTRIDLNLFRVLDAIVTEGGIGAAARALHLTQPAVTHALNRLRDHFEDPLFVRQGNRVVPTDKVRAIIEPVRAHLKGLQDAVRAQSQFDASTLQEAFVVGFRDILESSVFPGLLERISSQTPGVRVTSRRVPASDVDRELAAGSVDLVVDRVLRTGPHVVSRHLLDESLVVAMARNHVLAKAPLRRADYLAAHHVAVSQLGEAVALDVLLGQDGRFRHIRLVCQHYFSACQIAAGSDLLLTMPRSYATRMATLLPLVILPLPIKLKPIPVLMYWHESKQGDRAHAWLRDSVAASI